MKVTFKIMLEKDMANYIFQMEVFMKGNLEIMK